MTVAELIKLLQTFPPELRVAYCLHSEQCLLEAEQVRVVELQPARPDGWIHDNWRSRDKAELKESYVLFPGN